MAMIANTWECYDAFTGNYICSIANVSSAGTTVYGKDGSILRYDINDGRLTVGTQAEQSGTRNSLHQPHTGCGDLYLNNTFDGNNGFSLNVSVPDLPGSIRAVREGEYIIGGTGGKTTAPDLMKALCGL